ncbi:MAG: hypothetical protein AB7D46_08315 [Flavobacteriaceae bacterium]
MKNSFLKRILPVFFLLTTFVSFAQPGGPGGGTGSEEEASIDSGLIVLLIVGIAFAAYMILNNRKVVKG